ncbi:MAG: DegV family protein [Clostridia bacterium]|nr:DegV family protein [Clostridia bacterium]
MNPYVICTDSACDMSETILRDWEVGSASLRFRFEGEPEEYNNNELPAAAFYQKMRAGGVAKTSAVNVEDFKNLFAPYLENGTDILYLGFSSGISTTYNSARLAAQELAPAYPDRKILTVDTLAASAGVGLLIYLAVQQKKTGASIETVAQYVTDLRLKLCHWFTVDDLQYLKRGGRVSPTAAFVGGVLGIKPVMHVDNEGKLIPMSKVRGRRAALQAMADQYGQLVDPSIQAPVYISHGDCMQDVELLKKMLKEQYNADVEVVSDVGPVIGAHSGPGTLALFFVGKER